MVVGYHVIFGAYGFWLPNDPRGSWSDFVGSWELFRYGPANKTTERRSVAHRKHDASLRKEAKTGLARPPAVFSGIQARSIGTGFANYCEKSKLAIWACAILPDHVHLVVGASNRVATSDRWIENVVIQLKSAATRQLVEDGIHPFAPEIDDRGRHPKCFARGEWKVFLESGDVRRAIRYVELNPPKEGKPEQRWKFLRVPPQPYR